MKIHRIKCDRCGKEVPFNKARLLTIEQQIEKGTVQSCMPNAMTQMNANVFVPAQIDLCNECVKDILAMISGMEDYRNRL